MAQRIECGEEESQNYYEADWNDDHQAALLFLKAVVLARPFVMIALGEVNFFGDAALDILNCPGEISAAHTELHRDVATAILAIDHEGAFTERHVGDLRERNA